jgi:hypothetical protein
MTTTGIRAARARGRLDAEREIVALACRAPSIHNTQPWWWRIGPGRIDLFADRGRQLPIADPGGRNLVLSCGAALHHATVAAAAQGYAAEVVRMPSGTEADHLATIRLEPAPVTPAATAQLRALTERCTDRRRFTSWPVSAERLEDLATKATTDDVVALALTAPTARFRTELLISRAMTAQAGDADLEEEQGRWIGRPSADGVPVSVLVPEEAGAGARPTRFSGPARSRRTPAQERAETSDGLIVLATGDDDPAAWLACGETLSRLWLIATAGGLSVVPLSQVVEVEETRLALRHELFGRSPQILVRIGWQEISRRQLPRTPRRPVEDVLVQ